MTGDEEGPTSRTGGSADADGAADASDHPWTGSDGPTAASTPRELPDGGVATAVGTAEDPVDPSLVERLRRGEVSPVAYLRRLTVFDLAAYTLYGLALVFFLFPVLWVISVSVRPPGELFSYPFRLLPQTVSLAPYERVFREGMLTWLFNSAVITSVSVLGILSVAVPAAYAFSRFDFRGRTGLLGSVLLFQMISPIIIIVPLYTVMSSLGLVRSRAGLILLYLGVQTPFSIWLLKGYFDTIPRELDYAARIDGCNRFQTLRHVLLRPVAPGLAVVAIFNTVLTWSEFVLAYTVLGSEGELHTISIGVYKFQGQYGADWRAIAAASVVGMLPLVVVFLGLQRYFVKGLVEGSLKGQ
jgi:multiple sugar transport system permease protein